MKFIIGLVALLSIGPITAQELLTPQKIDIILRGNDALLRGQWKKADAVYDELRQADPGDPGGYLFRAAALQGEMIDLEANLGAESFRALLDSVRIYALLKLDSCSRRDSAVCYLYLGHRYAYLSLYEARFGSRLGALSEGLHARNEYGRSRRTDRTLYDLYLGLGSYHYWKSVKAGVMRYTGMFRNDRVRGIEEIKLAEDSSLFSRESARAAMIWIFINEREFDSAIALSQELYRRYPEGNSFLWPLAESYFEEDNYQKAADTYRQIFERLKENPGNYFNAIEAGYRFCVSLRKLGDKSQGAAIRAYFEQALGKIPREIRRRQRSRLGFILKHN